MSLCSIFLRAPLVFKSIPCLIITTLSGYNHSIQSSHHFCSVMLFLKLRIDRFLDILYIVINLSSLVNIRVDFSTIWVLVRFSSLFLDGIDIPILFLGLNLLCCLVTDMTAAILFCNKSLNAIPGSLLKHEKFGNSILKINAWYWKVRVSPFINVCRKQIRSILAQKFTSSADVKSIIILGWRYVIRCFHLGISRLLAHSILKHISDDGVGATWIRHWQEGLFLIGCQQDIKPSGRCALRLVISKITHVISFRNIVGKHNTSQQISGLISFDELIHLPDSLFIIILLDEI